MPKPLMYSSNIWKACTFSLFFCKGPLLPNQVSFLLSVPRSLLWRKLSHTSHAARPKPTAIPHGLHHYFIGLAYQGKDIVFTFIIEYSSLRDFGPYIIGLFLYEVFWKMIFWFLLKFKISYRVIIISWRILVSFRGFFEDYIFASEIFEFPWFFFCIRILF